MVQQDTPFGMLALPAAPGMMQMNQQPMGMMNQPMAGGMGMMNQPMGGGMMNQDPMAGMGMMNQPLPSMGNMNQGMGQQQNNDFIF